MPWDAPPSGGARYPDWVAADDALASVRWEPAALASLDAMARDGALRKGELTTVMSICIASDDAPGALAAFDAHAPALPDRDAHLYNTALQAALRVSEDAFDRALAAMAKESIAFDGFTYACLARSKAARGDAANAATPAAIAPAANVPTTTARAVFIPRALVDASAPPFDSRARLSRRPRASRASSADASLSPRRVFNAISTSSSPRSSAVRSVRAIARRRSRVDRVRASLESAPGVERDARARRAARGAARARRALRRGDRRRRRVRARDARRGVGAARCRGARATLSPYHYYYYYHYD